MLALAPSNRQTMAVTAYRCWETGSGRIPSTSEIAMFPTRLVFSILALGLLWASASFAQDVNLPGNASSLQEAHGDWTVSCRVAMSADGAKTKLCAISQQHVSQQTRQRALSIELKPDTGGAKGALSLPFGLVLDKGVSYQLDDGAVGATQRFRTCLPAGCVVDVNFDPRIVASLKTAKALKVKAIADGGQEVEFSISLNGFVNAYERASTLIGS